MHAAVLSCAECPTLNPVLYRYCRRCGAQNPEWDWPSRAGAHGLALPGGLVSPSLRWRPVWSSPGETRRCKASLVTGGALICVNEDASARLWGPEGQPLAYRANASNERLSAYPCVLSSGFLLLPLADQIQLVDLLSWAGLGAASSPRGSALALDGQARSHLASCSDDFALLVERNQRIWARCGQALEIGVEWRWSVALEAPATDDPWGCAWADGSLWIVHPGGQVWRLDRDSGATLNQWELGHPVQAADLQACGSRLAVPSYAEVLFAFESETSAWLALPVPGVGRPFALALAQERALLVGSQRHALVHLESGQCRYFGLPERCVAAPLLGAEVALMVSYAGTLFVVEVGGRQPAPRVAFRAEAQLSGGLLAPLWLRGQAVLVGASGELVALAPQPGSMSSQQFGTGAE